MIRVLIVDDSAVVRKVLSEELAKYEGIEVVGTAIDPYVARDKIVELNPDVITLDVEMPRMDGLTFLSKLMKFKPMPVVIVSSVTPEKSEAALRALSLGAVEVISKPGSAYTVPYVGRQLVRAIRAAARARIAAPSAQTLAAAAPQITTIAATHKILAVGASTGGTQAIEAVFRQLPATTPATVIVQHMPAGFTAAFAERLNGLCAMQIREAKDGDVLSPGLALIAPGGHHMVLARSGAQYTVRLKDGPPVHFQRPAVDVLFDSVAREAGRNAVGVVLTGMGADGAKGLLAMKQAGARTLVQDEATCVVYGMPKECVALGAADEIVPLPAVPAAIRSALEGK